MKNYTDIIALRQPESVDDPLTEIARDGARRMLAAALRAEADAFVAQHSEEVLPDGRQRVVRHGYGPERSIQTGIGALDVRRPKVRDRAADVAKEKKIRFTSGILPKWARRSRSLNALLPVLTVLGLQLGAVLAGAVITETVFSWPGIGLLTIEAIQSRDYPVVQACVLLISLCYVCVNLLTDLAYAQVDPRIRLGGGH